MNMPDLGLGEFAEAEAAVLEVVRDHLSWWPHRRWRRAFPGGAAPDRHVQ